MQSPRATAPDAPPRTARIFCARAASPRLHLRADKRHADRTHHPAVELAQALLGHRRKRMAMLLMSLFADRQQPPLDLKPLAGGGGLHHLDALGNDLEPDVVTRQDPDLQAHVMIWARQNRFGAVASRRRAQTA